MRGFLHTTRLDHSTRGLAFGADGLVKFEDTPVGGEQEFRRIHSVAPFCSQEERAVAAWLQKRFAHTGRGCLLDGQARVLPWDWFTLRSTNLFGPRNFVNYEMYGLTPEGTSTSI